MENNKAEVIFTLNDGTCNTTGDVTVTQEVKNARTIGLDYNTFLEYIDTPTKDRVQFLLDNGIDEFNF